MQKIITCDTIQIRFNSTETKETYDVKDVSFVYVKPEKAFSISLRSLNGPATAEIEMISMSSPDDLTYEASLKITEVIKFY
jgi:hypothetical protein